MAKSYTGISDLTNALALKRDITKKDADSIVRDTLDVLREELLDENKDGIQILDFITLKKIVRKSKLGRNPRDPSISIQIPERIGIKAELGKQFNTELNS